MFLHRSNCLHELVEQLCLTLDEGTVGLLHQDVVLIQSSGMERYLTREIARKRGIAAAFRFPFPRAFFREVLAACLQKEETNPAFERQQMTWTLYQLLAHLEQLPAGPARAQVELYLSDDVDGTRRFLLAEQLANLFDQYMTYRPKMVLSWQRGAEAEEFQAQVWRQLVAQQGSDHLAERCRLFLNQVTDDTLREVLPARLCVVGGPGLPPLFLQLLARLGEAVPVHLFAFSASAEYFADAHPLDDRLPERGQGIHPLLVSLGRVGADFQHLIEVVGPYREGSSRFLLPQPTSVLWALQRGLVEGQLMPSEFDQTRLVSGDDSITIDSCHSRLREVEILRDRLLHWFEQDSTLRAEDVVVFAPDIEAYSPYVAAVFSERSGETMPIPYRVADQSEGALNPAAKALLLFLQMLRGRLKVSEVLDLLQLAPVCERFEMSPSDLELVSSWLHQAGVRWGIDEQQRNEHSLPGDWNSFRFGLRRLLLGYALSDDGQRVWHGVVPFDGLSVESAPLLGRLVEYCERLFSFRTRLLSCGPRGMTLAQWSEFLRSACELLLAEDSVGRWDTGELVKMLSDWQQLTAKDEAIGLPAILHLVETQVGEMRHSTDFLSGGVTFCALLPLRTVPFRAVCVLGLNQGEFPRMDQPQSFDRMAQDPKRGDRTLRDDDRYLFLEVLLAARQRLALSYVGRSISDNAKRPGSMVLDELKQAVDELTGQHNFLPTTEHPLQPFNPSYFGGDKAFSFGSFDQHAYLGACAILVPPKPVEPFFGPQMLLPSDELCNDLQSVPKLEAPSQGAQELSLDELVRFWKSPSTAYLKACGVRLENPPEQLPDRESIQADGLLKYLVTERILKGLLTEQVPALAADLRRGDLPFGQAGQALRAQAEQEAHQLCVAAERYKQGQAAVAQSFVLVSERPRDLAGYGKELLTCLPSSIRLEGVVDQIYGASRLLVSFGKMRPRRRLQFWIEHLAACCADSPIEQSLAIAPHSDEPGRIQVLQIQAVTRSFAEKVLAQLSFLCMLGQFVPLRFFADASYMYMSHLHGSSKANDQKRIEMAVKKSRGKLSSFSEAAAILELYRQSDPLGLGDLSHELVAESPFAQLANSVLGPILARISEGEEV